MQQARERSSLRRSAKAVQSALSVPASRPALSRPKGAPNSPIARLAQFARPASAARSAAPRKQSKLLNCQFYGTRQRRFRLVVATIGRLDACLPRRRLPGGDSPDGEPLANSTTARPLARTAFHGHGLTQEHLRKAMRFRLRDDCPLWCVVPHASTTTRLCNFRRAGHDSDQTSYNPRHATRDHLHVTGLGGV
jgi:hypothetical protein